MAQITKSIAETHRLAAMLVPADILKSISQDELVDRIAEADRLGKRAADPSVPGDLRAAYKMRAQAVLTARPRDAVAREHLALIAKAAQLPGAHADAVRERARRLIEEEQPPAPRLAVRKAKADIAEMIPVFDQSGQLIGIADPGDITPVRGKPNPTPEENAQDGPGAENVAKATGMIAVYDSGGRPYLTYQRHIRKSAGDLVTLYDSAGRPYQVPSSVLQSPEVQARNTGPVRAGGTTGLGQPRKTGPAASRPADGPQRPLPGDVPDRTVIKSLNPGWEAVHDWRGVLVGAVKSSNVVAAPRPGTVAKSRIDQTHANVYDGARRQIGMARVSHILPVAELRKALGTPQPRRQAGR